MSSQNENNIENTVENTVENIVENAAEKEAEQAAEVKPQAKAKTETAAKTAAKAPAKATKTAEKAETKTAEKAETKTAAKAASGTTAKATAKTETKAETKTAAKTSETKTAAKASESKTATKTSESKTGTGKSTAAKAESKKAAEKAESKAQKEEVTEVVRKGKKGKRSKQDELEHKKHSLKHTRMELSERLKELLEKDIKDMKQQEKHRAAEILGVFAEHNFYANGFTPEEMRTTLEDLGPTYVKIGQIMSSRVDLLPERYCKELEKLRQNVKQLDPKVARAVIEEETGKKIKDLYSEFRDEPLGSASIGQVHYAVLKDGRKVVTKVQRPLIADMMRKDFVLLKKMAKIVNALGEKEDDSEQQIDLLSVITELEKVTDEELDFRVEAENTRFFKENCIDDESKVTCPTVIDELTTERIFTMTYVDGYSISKRDRMIDDGYDPMTVGRDILENYIHQVLDVGTFHADPHQGNIMVAEGKTYWIDFGMIGHITEQDVNVIQSLILSLLERDLDAMVNAIMSLGATSPLTNRNKLIEDVDPMFDKYMNVTSINDIDLSALLGEIMDLATKHHITLPGKYTMLVRSIATIEGVIEQLCPELNLFELISNKLMDRVKKNVDVKDRLTAAGKDALEMGKKTAKLPLLTYDALNNIVKGRTKINMELTGYEDVLEKANKTILHIALVVISCVLFFGSCILCTADIQPKTSHGVPLIAAVGIVFSLCLGIFTIRRMTKKK